MLHYLCDCQSLIDIAVQHRLDKINRSLTHDPWDSKLAVHDLVDAIEWVFLVNKCIEENAKCPDVLFFPTV